MSRTQRLVLSVSIGHRPWFELLVPYIRAYARRWRAHVRLVVEPPRWASPRARDLDCRERKIDAIFEATRRYEQVLYLDDSVFVRPDAPLIDLAPGETLKPPLCATAENHAPEWKEMLAAAFSYYGVPQRRQVLFNSGVMLLHAEHQVIFDRSQSRRMKKIGWFVDQLWVNVMTQKHHFPLRDLGVKYNFVGSFLTGRRSPIPVEHAHFFHITRGAGNSATRLAVARQLVRRFG